MAELHSDTNICPDLSTRRTNPGSSKEETSGAEARLYARCEALLGRLGGAHGPAELLAAAAYLLALDAGLAPRAGSACALPADWRTAHPGAYSAGLFMPAVPHCPCDLILSPISDCLLINCVIGEPVTSFSVCLSVGRYVACLRRVFLRFPELSLKIKDSVISPTRGAALTCKGIANGSLLGMPKELLMKIFGFLDPPSLSRVAASCRTLLCVARDPFLWENLFKIEFSDHLPLDPKDEESQDWFSVYKTAKCVEYHDTIRKRQFDEYTQDVLYFPPPFYNSLWEDVNLF